MTKNLLPAILLTLSMLVSPIAWAQESSAGPLPNSQVTQFLKNAWPNGIVFDRDGNLLVVEGFGSGVIKIYQNNTVDAITGYGGSGYANGPGNVARFTLPEGITIDGAGIIYVGDGKGKIIRRVTPGGDVTTLAGGPPASGQQDIFGHISALACDTLGNVFVADEDKDTISKIGKDGTVTLFAGKSGVAGHDDGPGAVATLSSSSRLLKS